MVCDPWRMIMAHDVVTSVHGLCKFIVMWHLHGFCRRLAQSYWHTTNPSVIAFRPHPSQNLLTPLLTCCGQGLLSRPLAAGFIVCFASCVRWFLYMGDAVTDHLNLERLRQVVEDNGDKLKELFEKWDEDASGFIDAKEFRNAIKALGFGNASDRQIDALFEKLDKDKNGQFDYKELMKAIKGVGKTGRALIASQRQLLEEQRKHEGGSTTRESEQEVAHVEDRKRVAQLEAQLLAARQAEAAQSNYEQEEVSQLHSNLEVVELREALRSMTAARDSSLRERASWAAERAALHQRISFQTTKLSQLSSELERSRSVT